MARPPPPTLRTPLLFPGCPPTHFCSSRVSGSPANLCITLFPPSFPKDLPPFLSAKPLIWRQRWVCYRFFGHFFFIAFCAVVLLTLLCLCVFVSLNVKLQEAWCYSVSHFGGGKGGLAAGEDLSCYFGNRATVCTILTEVMFSLFMPFLLHFTINLGSGTVNKFVNSK